MPELPEVETIKTAIAQRIGSARIENVAIYNRKLREYIPEDIEAKITGASTIDYKRMAKYIVMFLDNDLCLLWHMGMSGKIKLSNEIPEREKHDHIVIQTSNGVITYNDPRRFGLFTYCNTNNLMKHRLLSHVGVEPFSKDLTTEYLDILVDLPGGEVHNPKPVYFKKGSNSYVAYIFTKIEYGQTAGYRVSDLIYPGDLVANAGESITSVLDKIRNMLTEFEYFYDLDGHFVFQKKQSFIATMWSSGEDANSIGQVEQSKARNTANAYIFKDNQIITAMSNNPNLMNLRNDYSIWGERTSTSGTAIPIHLRFAIDTKPKSYKSINIDENDMAAKGQITVYNEKYKVKVPTTQKSIEYSTSKG
jgi:hypothetical protein